VVSDEDASRRWRLELLGIPGRLTIVEVATLQYSGSGEVEQANRILKSAIEDALMIPFSVCDQGGNEVATGLVGGEPVELEQGIYRVVVKSQPQQTLERVDVSSESDVVLKLN
jgi:hypothetical protein